jgi:hypothetical protein
MSGSFHVNFSLLVIEKIFEILHVKIIFLIAALIDPQGPWFEQTWISTISESCHVNLRFSGPVVLEKKILNIFQCIFTLRYYLPLEKRAALLYMNNFESPSPKDYLCQLCLQSVPRFWRSRKCKILTDTSDGWTMDDQKISLRFQLRWAKNKKEIFMFQQNLFIYFQCVTQ